MPRRNNRRRDYQVELALLPDEERANPQTTGCGQKYCALWKKLPGLFLLLIIETLLVGSYFYYHDRFHQTDGQVIHVSNVTDVSCGWIHDLFSKKPCYEFDLQYQFQANDQDQTGRCRFFSGSEKLIEDYQEFFDDDHDNQVTFELTNIWYNKKNPKQNFCYNPINKQLKWTWIGFMIGIGALTLLQFVMLMFSWLDALTGKNTRNNRF